MAVLHPLVLVTVGLVALLVTGLLLWTVRRAALEARAVTDRLAGVRDRVTPLTDQLASGSERAQQQAAALRPEPGRR